MESPNIDPILLSLVNAAEEGLSIELTLLLNGQVVSGNLISTQNYLQGITTSFSNAGIQSNLTLDESNNYLHFANACIRQSTPPRDITVAFLRVQLISVNGFSLGIPAE